jgi:hypothetical protein
VLLVRIGFNVDPDPNLDPAFYLIADPNPDPNLGSQTNADPRGSGSWSDFKGTVRPDWICMRVVSLKSPLKGHQPLYVFNFLFLILNF